MGTLNDLGPSELFTDGEPARLHLAGIETPIVTRITQQSARGMRVEQELPFLRLRTQVWGEARKPSRIESVSVEVHDGTPRLVLELAFDDHEDDAALAPPAPAAAHRGVMRPRTRVDHTVPFDRTPLPLPASSAAAPRREHETVSLTAAAERPLSAEVAGMALSSKELELLQPHDWVFHVRLLWLRAKPHLRRAASATRELALRLAKRAWPVLLLAATKAATVTSAYGRLLWRRAVLRRSNA